MDKPVNIPFIFDEKLKRKIYKWHHTAKGKCTANAKCILKSCVTGCSLVLEKFAKNLIGLYGKNFYTNLNVLSIEFKGRI